MSDNATFRIEQRRSRAPSACPTPNLQPEMQQTPQEEHIALLSTIISPSNSNVCTNAIRPPVNTPEQLAQSCVLPTSYDKGSKWVSLGFPVVSLLLGIAGVVTAVMLKNIGAQQNPVSDPIEIRYETQLPQTSLTVMSYTINGIVIISCYFNDHLRVAVMRSQNAHHGYLGFNNYLELAASHRPSMRWYIPVTLTVNAMAIFAQGSAAIFDTLQIPATQDPSTPLVVRVIWWHLLVCGAAIACQSMVVLILYCFHYRSLLTFSDDCLDVAAACVIHCSEHYRHDVRKRTMAVGSSNPALQFRQPPMKATDEKIPKAFKGFAWTTFAAACVSIFGMTYYFNTPGSHNAQPNYSPIYSDHTPTMHTGELGTALTFFILCAAQTFIVLAFHLADMLVLRRRNEVVWRRAGKGKTSRGLLKGWLFSISPAILLLQTLVNTFLDHSVFQTRQVKLGLAPVQAMYATITFLIVLSVLFWATFRWRPKGPQPAAYGRIPTLINLIDDWTGFPDRPFYWGEKTWPSSQGPVVTVGTSVFPLKAPDLTRFHI